MKVEWTEIVHSPFCARNEGRPLLWQLARPLLRLLGGVVEVLDLGHAIAVRVIDEGLLLG